MPDQKKTTDKCPCGKLLITPELEHQGICEFCYEDLPREYQIALLFVNSHNFPTFVRRAKEYLFSWIRS